MFKATPYIQTIGNDRYKELILQSFDYNQLGIIDNANCQILFDGWKGKNMGNWMKYTNEDKITLEFYSETYTINKKGKIWTFPLPKTVDDFINDMFRVDVQIYWNAWIDERFEPKDFMRTDEISDYFTKLLIKMGKIEDLGL